MLGTLGEVLDGSTDPRGGLDWVGVLSGRSGTGRRPSERSGMGQRTLVEVWDGSGHPWGGLGRVGRPSGRFRTGLNTV